MIQTTAVNSFESESLLEVAIRGGDPARAAGRSTHAARGRPSAVLGSLLPILAGFLSGCWAIGAKKQ